MNAVAKQIKIYKKALSHRDVWTKTPLLRILADRLQGMLNDLESMGEIDKKESPYVSVYVLLYHQCGGQLTIWENMIKKVQYAVERRPVYLSLNEAKLAIRDHSREGIVMLSIPRHAVLETDGLRYLNVKDVRTASVTGFFWNKKLFHLNELSLIELNSVLTD